VSDPDDWFGGAAADDDDDAPRRRAADEDWLREAPAPTAPWYEGIERRYVVAAVIALAALIAVLAAAGVFSGGGHKTTPPPATVTTTPAPTPTPTPTPTPSVPAPTSPLKPGDTGAQVKVLQRALKALGYPVGKVDGGYGPTTQAAVKSFQQKAGLKADGIAGSATLKALKTALRNR
jgi:hypothetical protein